MKFSFKYQWVFLIGLIITGCSITKRVYQPGYHIEWKNKKVLYQSVDSDEKFQTSVTYQKKLELKKNEDDLNLQTKATSTQVTYANSKKKNNTSATMISPILNKTLEKKIVPQKIKMLFSSSMKGVNLQEPNGQLFLLGILSLVFLGGGIALLYFTTPPQFNTGYLLLLLGTICLLAFLRILAGMFADWAFG